MKNPNLILIYPDRNTLFDCDTCINGKWMPARPIGLSGFSNRIKLAWMVFTGKADAVKWPGGQ